MRTLHYLALFALGMLYGCGKVGGEGNPRVDGGPDAPPPDAPSSDVNVTVLTQLSDGMPQVGAIVAFHDPDMKVVRAEITPYDGPVSSALPKGGAVTVAWIGTSNAKLLTIMGVEAGESLVVGTNEVAREVTTTTKVKFTPLTAAASTLFTRCNPEGIPIAGTTAAVEVIATFRKLRSS